MKIYKGEIAVVKAGAFTSVQDAGRFGHAEFGVPSAGFMDACSAGIANLLLGKEPTAPCLEIFAGGVSFQVNQPCLIVCSGAEADIQVGSKVYQIHQPISLKAGEIIEIFPFRSGQWLYLAVFGDIVVSDRMKSKSFYFPITTQSRLRNGDIVDALLNGPDFHQTNCRVGCHDWKQYSRLDVFPGPDFHRLSGDNQNALVQTSFTLSTNQNRMGVQLVEALEHNLPEILSAPVFPGTVQLTPSGKLIVLMRDAQVTGGYPRILQVTEASISLLAQKRPGEKVTFSLLPPPLFTSS
jgi:biotin-dependent carboxylase-like uncharacterized protein